MPNTHKPNYQNFANTFSTIDAPAEGNSGVPQQVNINNLDTPDFDRTSDGALIAMNPGRWRFLAQFQLAHIPKKDYSNEVAIVDGFYALNDEPIADSDATNSVSIMAPKNVLPIEFCVDLKKGDKVAIFAASTNANVGLCRGYKNNGSRDLSGNPTNNTGISAPSVILTASKLPEVYH